ncbi:MAG TPA: HdeD family acid-resistance protein [Ramlibacter sp.]
MAIDSFAIRDMHHAAPSTPIIVRGVAGIVFGAIALFVPGIALASLVMIFAAYLLLDGIFALMASARAARVHSPWGWLALEGVVTVLAGGFALLMPGATVVALMVLLAVWACLSGVLLVIAALTARPHTRGRWWLALAGVVSLVWGGLLFGWPGAGAIALVLWLGAYALVFGVVLLVTGARMRSAQRSTREFLP